MIVDDTPAIGRAAEEQLLRRLRAPGLTRLTEWASPLLQFSSLIDHRKQRILYNLNRALDSSET